MKPTMLGAAFLASAAAFAASATATAGSLADPPEVWSNHTDMMRSAYSGRNTVAVMQRSIRCIVQRARGASENLLQTIPDTRAEYRLIYGPIASRLDQCSYMGVHVSNILLRGAIAEALYRTDLAARTPQSRGAEVAPIRWPEGHANAQNLAPVYELGRCVVAEDAPGVHELLATTPYSAEERRIFDALGPRLQSCLDAGSTFATNRETIRAVLAKSLYRWARAQRGALSPR